MFIYITSDPESALAKGLYIGTIDMYVVNIMH